jgi:hypothetical protein
MDWIGALIGGGLSLVDDLITTSEEQAQIDLSYSKLQGDAETRALEGDRIRLERQRLTSAGALAQLSAAQQQKRDVLFAGVALAGIGTVALVLLLKGGKS